MFARIVRIPLACCIAICLMSAGVFGQQATAAPAPVALRVLILTGDGHHDWQTEVPFLRHILDGTGRFDVRVCETPNGLTVKTLADVDVIVNDYAGPAL